MKNIFYILLLLPTFIFAQYPSNSGHKITLGEQTTADGLIWRGVAATDTVRKPSIDTMAYMVLDTTTNIIWHYKKATSNAWLRLNLLPSDTTSIAYVKSYGTQTVNGAKTFSSNLSINSSASTLLTMVSSAASTFFGMQDNSGNNIFFGSDDGDFLVQTPSNSYTTKFITKNNGNVGIGTTSPSAVLHLKAGTATANTAPLKFTSGTNLTTPEVGAMEFSLFNGANRLFITPESGVRKEIGYADLSNVSGTLPVANGGTNASTFTAGSVVFAGSGGTYTQDNSGLFYDNTNDRLGIVTSTPSYKLHIKPTSSGRTNHDSRMLMTIESNSEAYYSVNVPSNGYGGFRVHTTPAEAATAVFEYWAPNKKFYFLTGGFYEFNDKNNNKLLTIDSTGFIGINQVTPSERLHVVGNGLFTGSVTANSLSLTTPLSVANGGTNRTTMPAGYILHGDGTSVDTAIGLFWDRSQRFLGVGTNNPVASLQINSSTTTPTMAFSQSFSNTSAQRGSFAFYNSSISTVASIIAQAVTDNVGTDLEFYTRPVGGSLTKNMVILNNGNVGIGNTSPGSRLVVKGIDGTSTNSALNVTNSSDASLLFVRNDGNVGVGTNSPIYKLDVAGSGRILLTSTTSPTLRLDYTSSSNYANHLMNPNGDYVISSPASNGVTSGNLVLQSGTDLRVFTNNTATNVTPQLTINTSGNLGLGVTPSAWNSIYKVAEIGTASVFGSSAYNNAAFTTNVFYNASNSPRYIANDFSTMYWQDDGQHLWYTAPSGTAGNPITFTQAMTLGANNGLSIGATTQAPANGLLVAGAATFSSSVTATNAMFNGVVTINNNIRGFVLNRDAVTYYNGIGYQTATVQHWFVGMRENLSSNDYVIYNESGYDNFKLSKSSGVATFSSSVIGTSFEVGNGQYYRARRNSSNLLIDLLGIESGTDNTRLLITGDYNIKNGSLTTLFNMTTTGAATFSSLGTGTVYSSSGTLTNTNPSDERLKNNINDISWGLSDILKLRPVSFNWKDDRISQGKQFGFIAQEVREVMPEAIKIFGEDVKYLGLEKDAIYATLVKAVQELSAEINILKQEIINLKNK